MMLNHQRGFILIVVLIFFQVLALLGWYALEMNKMENKMNQSLWESYIFNNLSEQALAKAEKNFDQHVSECNIKITADLKSRPIEWWQSFASCTLHFDKFEYYYVIEALGEDPCAYLENQEQQISADYFRISLLGLSAEDDSKVLLQSTLVKPHQGATLGCQEVAHRVTIGRQMVRSIF